MRKAEIPDTVEEIEDFAFADCGNLEQVSLSGKKGLTRIGISAFENCGQLRKVEFPAALEILDAASFAGCGNLEQVHFAEGTQLKFAGDHCFQRCTKLGDVEIPMQEEQEEEVAD